MVRVAPVNSSAVRLSKTMLVQTYSHFCKESPADPDGPCEPLVHNVPGPNNRFAHTELNGPATKPVHV